MTSGGKGMGNIDRYDVGLHVQKLPDGRWVRYDDHVAECDRLRAEVEQLKADRAQWWAKYVKAAKELKEADEEVERLRKAIQLAECQHLRCGGNLTPRETVVAIRRILCGALENPPPAVPNCEVEPDPDTVAAARKAIDEGEYLTTDELLDECKQRRVPDREGVSNLGVVASYQELSQEFTEVGGQPNYIPYTRETWPMDLTAVWLKGACYQLVELQECQAVFLASKCTKAISYMTLVTCYFKPDGSPCGQEVEARPEPEDEA